ncbi:MAG: hypothetical protein GY762_16960 [Proteobacteria bacterium]|nr:hypothetical protein [Pseudomonadota bacterium]
MRHAKAGTASPLHWIHTQAREQALADKVSEIRYFCVNDMAFDLAADGKRIDPGENRIVVTDEETKKNCRLPWMPVFTNLSTVMSAVSPTNGFGALLVTMYGNSEQIGARLKQAGWRESAASVRLHQAHPHIRGYLYEQKGAWMLVVFEKAKNTNETTALFAGRWNPDMIESQ